MSRMHRTQIYLEPDLSAALDRLARKRGVSRASLIRLAARRLLDQERAGDIDPIVGIVGLGRANNARISEEHDRALSDYAIGADKR